MKWTPLRLLSALFAFALFATACGSDAATETSEATVTTQPDEAISDDEMSEMEEDEHGEHDGDHTSAEDAGADHSHGEGLDVTSGNPTPSVAILVEETDITGTYELMVDIKNFEITPENVDGDPVANEGHMHLLVDGVKVEKFYDLERTVELEPGDHVVEVELNANNHLPWTVEGARINATQLVQVPGVVATADVVIDVSFNGGAVQLSGGDRIELELGQTVQLLIASDVEDEVHLHGYDITVAVSPESGGILNFTADTAGKFEVEFENSGVFIAELLVS